MSSLRAAFYLWKAYQYYWIGSSGYEYAKTAWKCYSLTHPAIRWCYQKIYRKNPDSWGDELRRKEYRLLAELDALRQEKEESGESRESGYIEDKASLYHRNNHIQDSTPDEWLVINSN